MKSRANRGDRNKGQTAMAMALLSMMGVGYVTLNRILDLCRRHDLNLLELAGWTPQELMASLPLGCADIAQVLSRFERRLFEQSVVLMQKVDKSGAIVLLRTDSCYPARLIEHLGRAAPPVVYVRDRGGLLGNDFAAVVGARDASPRGLALARKCAAALHSMGVSVVSGGARGVDLEAHLSAIEAGGTTLIIPPEGILNYRALRHVAPLIEGGSAAVLSGSKPDGRWTANAAVRRNSTVCAFAKLICVIEPRMSGGSIRTARVALTQRKKVLIYCAEDHKATMKALLQAGAQLLTDGDGALDERVLRRHWTDAAKTQPRHPELF